MNHTLTLEDLIAHLEASRSHFLKHLEGVDPAMVALKPHAECKSVLETLQHMVIVDRSAMYSMQTGKVPDYESYSVEESDMDSLLALMSAERAKLVAMLQEMYQGKGIAEPFCCFGSQTKLALGLFWLSSEDSYHAGQIAYIRMAHDPTWDYYKAIYHFES